MIIRCWECGKAYDSWQKTCPGCGSTTPSNIQERKADLPPRQSPAPPSPPSFEEATSRRLSEIDKTLRSMLEQQRLTHKRMVWFFLFFWLWFAVLPMLAFVVWRLSS